MPVDKELARNLVGKLVVLDLTPLPEKDKEELTDRFKIRQGGMYTVIKMEYCADGTPVPRIKVNGNEPLIGLHLCNKYLG